MLDELKCKKDKSLIEAWKIINKNTKGIVFITGERDKVYGVLSVGDIRRYLLSGGKLESDLEKVIKKEFIYAKDSESNEELVKKVNSKITIIPIVNENFELIDYFEYNKNVNIPVAIPDLKGNEFNYLTDAFLSTWISSAGKYIIRFENEFSAFCQCKYGVAVSNGTVALHLALKCLNIGEGNEVIVPDLTFAATINAVLHAQATPVIVDVEEESWCIDPDEIEKAITPATKAIIPVHLYGQPCNMDAIMTIARRYNLFVVEDCAEAHGAEYDGKKVGSFGDIGCFSFYGNKIITTGEGGMCVTNNKDYAEKMRILRDHGMNKTKKYFHEYVGYNYRLTNLQASIGLAQLERINEILNDRKRIETMYKESLSELTEIEFQRDDLPKRKKVTWLVCSLINDKRDVFMDRMKESGIDTRPFFLSLGKMDIYTKYVFSNKNSNNICMKGINFPTNNIVDDKVFKIIKNITKNI